MTVLHCAMCVRYNGESVSEVEAGENLKLDWQPSAGWGLQEAHYTDDQDQVVPIDLSTREFTMPDYDIVIEGTAKRFTVQDWTANSPDDSGKVLGIDESGNIVPVEAGGGEEPTYDDTRSVLFVGDDGKPTTDKKFLFTSSSGGSLEVGEGSTMWGSALHVNKVSVAVGVDFNVLGLASFGSTAEFGDKATFYEDIQVGDKGAAKAIILFDSVNQNNKYELKVTNGQLVITQV